jgi:hypothetical protein
MEGGKTLHTPSLWKFATKEKQICATKNQQSSQQRRPFPPSKAARALKLKTAARWGTPTELLNLSTNNHSNLEVLPDKWLSKARSLVGMREVTVNDVRERSQNGQLFVTVKAQLLSSTYLQQCDCEAVANDQSTQLFHLPILEAKIETNPRCLVGKPSARQVSEEYVDHQAGR